MSIQPGQPVNPTSQQIAVRCYNPRRGKTPRQANFTIGLSPRYRTTDDVLADLDMLRRYATRVFREREGLHGNARVDVHFVGIVPLYT